MTTLADAERIVLFVHGVQTGTDKDLHHDKILTKAIKEHLPMPLGFAVDAYRYENVNDKAQQKLRKVLALFFKLLSKKVPMGGLVGKLMDKGVDLIGDVVLNLKDGKTAREIRAGLRERVLGYRNRNQPVWLVGHSLGSVYCFDLVNEFICEGLIDPHHYVTWPVQALVTVGSPLGLSIFRDKRRLMRLASDSSSASLFWWLNYWDPTDPVVSGSFYGNPNGNYSLKDRYGHLPGWYIEDHRITTGHSHLAAHCAYLTSSEVVRDLIRVLAM